MATENKENDGPLAHEWNWTTEMDADLLRFGKEGEDTLEEHHSNIAQYFAERYYVHINAADVAERLSFLHVRESTAHAQRFFSSGY